MGLSIPHLDLAVFSGSVESPTAPVPGWLLEFTRSTLSIPQLQYFHGWSGVCQILQLLVLDGRGLVYTDGKMLPPRVVSAPGALGVDTGTIISYYRRSIRVLHLPPIPRVMAF